MSKVKIGFAGVGFMGQLAHLANYVQNDQCEIVAIAEPRTGLAQKVAEHYHLTPRFYTDHKALLDDPDVEAVVASQPFLRNGYITIPLLKAGKSVFIEKPMAGSLAEAEAMAEAAQSGGGILAVGFMKRHDSGVQRVCKELEAIRANTTLGAAGMITAHCFCGDWLRGVGDAIQTDEQVPDGVDYQPRHPDWMTPGQVEMFGDYMNIFSHNINLIRHIYPGEYKAKSLLLKRNKLNQIGVMEVDGALATLYGTLVSAGWWEEDTAIYFENGWLRLTTPSPMDRQASATAELYHGGADNTTRILRGRPYWAFRAQADDFVRCVAKKQQPIANGQDSVEDMRLMEALFRKAEWA